MFNEELQLNDLLFIEKRLERLEKEQNKKRDAQKAAIETDLLLRMKSHLDKGCSLRSFVLSGDEEKLIASYPFLTRKTVIIILNVGEDAVEGSGPDPPFERAFPRSRILSGLPYPPKLKRSFLCSIRQSDRSFSKSFTLISPPWTG